MGPAKRQNPGQQRAAMAACEVMAPFASIQTKAARRGGARAVAGLTLIFTR